MSDQPDVEIIPPEEIEAQSHKARPRRFGVPVLIGASFLSAALGAGLIYLTTTVLAPPKTDLSPLSAKLESQASKIQALSSENKTLKAQLTRLQRDIKALPKQKTVDVSELEARLAELETKPPQSLDPDLVARLEALQEDGSGALDLSDILARLTALEDRPVAVATVPAITAPQEMPAQSTRAAIPFPKSTVLAAIDDIDGDKSWLQKSLKKHISVQSEDNPRFLVEEIERHLAQGNMEAAGAAFDNLPARAKAAAKDWRESLEN